MSENKVTFGLKNAHYAKITENADGTLEYATPVALPGATELALDPRGDQTEFYADDSLYYYADNNQGYDGTLTIANIPESFAIDILGETKDVETGVITENADAKGSYFAFLFEFDGDVNKTKHVNYYCKASRPSAGSSTKSDSVEPNTSELSFISSPRPVDYKVKAKTSSTTTKEVLDNWYNSVFGASVEPLEVNVTPVDAATDIALDSTIKWEFNKTIDAKTVIASNFLILNSTGDKVEGTFALDQTGKVVTFTPSTNLVSNTVYIATILKSLKAVDGSTLTDNLTINFTTVTA